MINLKLMTVVIHGTWAPVYTKKYTPVCISPYLGQIRHVVDNKCLYHVCINCVYHFCVPFLWSDNIQKRWYFLTMVGMSNKCEYSITIRHGQQNMYK